MKKIINNLYETNLFNSMVNRIDSLKKWRVGRDVIENTLKGILTYIDAFNQLGKYDTRVLGRDFKDIMILDEFKDFLEPASVQMDPADLECSELLMKDEDNAEAAFVNLSYNEYLDYCSAFRGFFKKDTSNETTTLDVIRKCVSWSEVSELAAFETKDGIVVRYNDGKPYLPLHVEEFLMCGWKRRHFNAKLEDILEDYVEMWLV